MPTAKLSPRQQEIMQLLNTGLTVREIAEELDVTRNAVYLQIQKMRNKGALEPDFTATGRPLRELRAPGQRILSQLLAPDEESAAAGSLALIEELRRTRDECGAIARRIDAILPQ